MATAQIIGRGFGPGASIAFVVTAGFYSGEEAPSNPKILRTSISILRSTAANTTISRTVRREGQR